MYHGVFSGAGVGERCYCAVFGANPELGSNGWPHLGYRCVLFLVVPRSGAEKQDSTPWSADARGLRDTWSMRILHTSDWHIGRTLHGQDLSDSVDAFFSWLLQLVEARSIELVLISGDLFDRAVPPLNALARTSKMLEELSAKARVIITSGNHDSATRLGLFSPMLDQRLVVTTGVDTIGTAVEHGGPGGCLIYPIPYLEPDLVRQELSDLAPLDSGLPAPLPRSHEAVVAAALRRVRADLELRREAGDQRPAIVMLHEFLTGGAPSDSERVIEVGGVGCVPAALLDTLGGEEQIDLGVVYAALGHLHRPQSISGARMPLRYSGSPIAYSFSEAGVDKSVVLLDVHGDSCEIELVPIPVHRPLALLRGTMEDLLADPDPALVNAYCSISVTDDARPQQMVSRIREVYPHALVILHESTIRSSIPSGAPGVRSRAPQEVTLDFFAAVGGRELDAREAQIVSDVWTDMRKEGLQ